MIINSTNLDAIRAGFKTSFMNGLQEAPSQLNRIASVVPSATREEKYGWLGKIPSVREWLGARQVQNISEHDYAIKNRDFELTIGVPRNDIEDDNLGVYSMLFEEMGMSTGAHADELLFGLLAAGFTTACYDGQYFFDTDHPVLDANGNPQSVANTDGGSGAAWYLMSTKRALKPMIFQQRKPWTFVPKDDPRDDNVFSNKELIYGADARVNVGFGFWQFAWGSKQILSIDNYEIARQSLMGMKGDYGRPLGLVPDVLIVPPTLEREGMTIVNAERDAAGATNVYKDSAELLVVPWLA